MKTFILLLAPFLLLGILYLSIRDWRTTLKAVLVLVVLEGALRKWVLPQASQFIYFLKDFVLIGAYLRYYIFSDAAKNFRLKGNPIAEVLALIILLFTGWCVFQIFNPGIGSPIVGIFGMRGYLLYVPMMWMLPNLFQSREELYRFLRNYSLLIIPVCILGILQYFAPASSPLNTYAPDLKQDIATVGENVRVTGTFSYVNTYSPYLITSFGLLVALFTVKQPPLWRWITSVEMLLIIVNSLMTGSRSVVFAQLLFLAAYALTQLFNQPVQFIRRFTLPIVAAIVALMIWFRSAFENFYDRTTTNQDAGGRIGGYFAELPVFLQLKGFDSYGAGATHQAVPTIRSMLGLPPGEAIPVYAESEPGRVLLEIGPFGFLLWYFLRLTIIWFLWRTYCKLQQPFLRQLALSACLIHLVQIATQLVFNQSFLPYYWFLASFIFVLPRLEQIDQEQVTQQIMVQSYLN